MERNSYITKSGLWADPYIFLITSPRYFEDVVWPSYLKYNKHILCLENENEENNKHTLCLENKNGKDNEWLVLDSGELNIEQMVGKAISKILTYLTANS
jgi:hypothetical protein